MQPLSNLDGDLRRQGHDRSEIESGHRPAGGKFAELRVAALDGEIRMEAVSAEQLEAGVRLVGGEAGICHAGGGQIAGKAAGVELHSRLTDRAADVPRRLLRRRSRRNGKGKTDSGGNGSIAYRGLLHGSLRQLITGPQLSLLPRVCLPGASSSSRRRNTAGTGSASRAPPWPRTRAATRRPS